MHLKTYGSRSRLSSSPLLSPTPVSRDETWKSCGTWERDWRQNIPGKANCPTKSPHSDSESSSTLWVMCWMRDEEVLPTCDPMPVLQLVEGRLQDCHELAIQIQPGTESRWLSPEFPCSPPRARELPSQQWGWCPPLCPSSGRSSGRLPGNSQSHCSPVRWIFEAVETQHPPQVQIRLVPCFLAVEHFLLCNVSDVSFNIKTRFTCMCKDHQGRPQSLHRIPTKEQLQAPCLPAPVSQLRLIWDKFLKWIGNCGHQ